MQVTPRRGSLPVNSRDSHSVNVNGYLFYAPGVLNATSSNVSKTHTAATDEWVSSIHKPPSASKLKTGDASIENVQELGLCMLAAQAILDMKMSEKSQVVFIRGKHDVEKWSQASLFAEHILQICTKQSGVKTRSRFAASLRILCAFSHVATQRNSSLPRVGLNFEFQFDQKNKFIGAAFYDYVLNTAHLTNSAGARNFHVLHYLSRTADPSLREALCLLPIAHNECHALLEDLGAQGPSNENDSQSFTLLREDLSAIGISEKMQMRIFSILAAILHLGDIQFGEAPGKRASSLHTVILNPEKLANAAKLLGVEFRELEDIVLCGTTSILGDRVAQILSPTEVLLQTSKIIESLYSLLYKWIIEMINFRLASKSAKKESNGSDTGSECARVINLCYFPDSPELPSSSAVVYDTSSEQWDTVIQKTAKYFEEISNALCAHAVGTNIAFTIPTINQGVNQIDVEIPLNIVSLFATKTSNPLIQEIFFIKTLRAAINEKRSGFLQLGPAKSSSLLPKTSRTNRVKNALDSESALMNYNSSLTDLAKIYWTCNPRWIFCSYDNLVNSLVHRKSHIFSLAGKKFDMVVPSNAFLNQFTPLAVSHGIDAAQTPRKLQADIFRALDVGEAKEISVGQERCLVLSWQDAWKFNLHFRLYQNWLKKTGGESNLDDAASVCESDYSEVDHLSDKQSEFEAFKKRGDDDNSEIEWTPQSDRGNVSATPNSEKTFAETKTPPKYEIGGFNEVMSSEALPEMPDKKRNAHLRRRWLILVRLITWWIPDFVLSCFGMKELRPRQAWREKFAIFIIILFISACVVMSFIVTGSVICPRSNLMSVGDMRARSVTTPGKVFKVYAPIYGNVYNIGELANSVSQHDVWTFSQLQGIDLTSGFPRRPVDACPDFATKEDVLLLDNSDFGAQIKANHAKMSASGTTAASNYLKNNARGQAAYTKEEIAKNWMAGDNSANSQRIIVEGKVYDLTPYYNTNKLLGASADTFLNIPFKANSGSQTLQFDKYISSQASQGMVDFTNDPVFMTLWKSSGALRSCMGKMFLNGVVDDRGSLKCMFADYVMFATSLVLILTILIKFLSSFMMPRAISSPGRMDKFVVIQVPCYTEDEPTIRQTLNSLAMVEYDDKKKLIMIICDGMIMGRGNDRSTPQIVLDILGVDTITTAAKAYSYQAVGHGSRQKNNAKIYSGLYEYRGRLVPYIVLIKCGTEEETSKPGNRGKRDSQMMTFRFFNKIHMKYPMNPMELELRYHLQYIIGVDPSWYEYMLMVDADTTLEPQAITQLIAFCMTDTEVVGCCGETKIINEKATFVAMIQVYEYFISHNLAKAFESLFGTVTCLPGCFCMYRIFSAAKRKPLLVDNRVIQDYGDINSDTLHEKNLLTLGEDRYLTTLMLKNFPKMRTKFIPAAVATTQVPETFSVLLSQRRRWINSTVHNLVELLHLSNLCGFCLFSMRFFIMLDLIATIIQPATVVYLIYVLYRFIAALADGSSLSVYTLTLMMLGIIYGCQMLVFIFRKEFSMIVWMFFYFLAVPVFGFFLPLYSFWNMDNFSWGSTRRLHKSKSSSASPAAKHGPLRSDRDDDEAHYNIAKNIPHTPWSIYLAARSKTESTRNRKTLIFATPPSLRASRAAPARGVSQYANSQLSPSHFADAVHTARRGYSPQALTQVQKPLRSPRHV